MAEQTYVKLSNGVKIPQFGLGVYMIQGDDATEKAVSDALKLRLPPHRYCSRLPKRTWCGSGR